MKSLETLSCTDLVKLLSNANCTERLAIAELVLHLAEIDRRQYYRDMGYSSLFAFCVNFLKYSEGATQRRISAARALQADPRVYELLKSGEVSLCTVSILAKQVIELRDAKVLDSIQGKA